MIQTLSDFLTTVATLSYEYGEHSIIRTKYKENEIKKFVDCFLSGTQILSDGQNGKPLVLKGIAETDEGATGTEALDFHNYQLYDFSNTDGTWYVLTFNHLSDLEQYMLGEGGYLNFYSTQMLVFENGIHKPFEVLFEGNEGIIIPIDADQFDTPLDISAMQDKLSVNWLNPADLEPLTDAQVEAYKESLAQKENVE